MPKAKKVLRPQIKVINPEIPTRVKIGPHFYTIIFCHQDDVKNRGECNRATLTIKIEQDMPWSTTWVTLLREVINIINISYKEKVVEPLANNLFDFLIRNKLFKEEQTDLPRTVFIGHHKYQVLYDDKTSIDLGGSCGQCKSSSNEIEIRNEMKLLVKWDTFLHESLHAINLGLKEDNIEMFSVLMFMFLVDNNILLINEPN